jgi:hypothetical protein
MNWLVEVGLSLVDPEEEWVIGLVIPIIVRVLDDQ